MANENRLTRDQARSIDRYAIETLGVPSVVLMENAGLNAADVAAGMLEAVEGSKVAIVCGGGNNGGDGLVIARHLTIAGHTAVVYLAADPAKLSGDAKIQYDICHRMGVKLMRIDQAESLSEQSGHWSAADVLIDALLGTGYDAERGLGEQAGRVIEAINRARQQREASNTGPLVLSIDLPSGMDCDTGGSTLAVKADATVTFVAPKAGFASEEAGALIGEVFVVGIGVPAGAPGIQPEQPEQTDA